MKAIQIQVSITLDENAAKSLAELLSPAIKEAIGLTTNELDQRKNERLKSSRNAIFGGEQPPDDQGLLIGYREAGNLLNVSAKTVERMHTSGQMPPPIRIGRAVRWSLEVLKKWVETGCQIDPTWRKA